MIFSFFFFQFQKHFLIAQNLKHYLCSNNECRDSRDILRPSRSISSNYCTVFILPHHETKRSFSFETLLIFRIHCRICSHKGFFKVSFRNDLFRRHPVHASVSAQKRQSPCLGFHKNKFYIILKLSFPQENMYLALTKTRSPMPTGIISCTKCRQTGWSQLSNRKL